MDSTDSNANPSDSQQGAPQEVPPITTETPGDVNAGEAPPAEPAVEISAPKEAGQQGELVQESVPEVEGSLMWPIVGGFGVLLALIAALLVVRTSLKSSAPAGGLIADTAPAPVADKPETAKAEEPAAEEESGLTGRLITALSRSRAALKGRFDDLFGRSSIDESLFEELEEVLLTSDVGMPTTERILDALKQRVAKGDVEIEELRQELKHIIMGLVQEVEAPLGPPPADGPWVILVVGVNGSGKTTTIGKLAARFKRQGKAVMLAAGDTYRAAAAEQLQVWAERADVALVRQEQGADPGAVIYNALESALSKKMDIVIIDTAGRLQTRKPLMEQLKKIRRVIAKHVPEGPHETLLVLDGTMGQNGLSQARLFDESTPLTGTVVTKLDGTAKGGMVLALSSELKLPVKLIGIGEQIDDLKDFNATAFVDALM